MIVSDDRCQKALKYLASTDEDAARAKAHLEGLQEQRKTVKAMMFMQAEGAQQTREQQAYNSDEYKQHIEKIENAVLDFETLKQKRLTEALIIEVWRSCNSNRRTGNI